MKEYELFEGIIHTFKLDEDTVCKVDLDDDGEAADMENDGEAGEAADMENDGEAVWMI